MAVWAKGDEGLREVAGLVAPVPVVWIRRGAGRAEKPGAGRWPAQLLLAAGGVVPERPNGLPTRSTGTGKTRVELFVASHLGEGLQVPRAAWPRVRGPASPPRSAPPGLHWRSPSAWMTLARRSRSASARAMARIMLSFRSMCLISTLVTLMPQLSVCASRICCVDVEPLALDEHLVEFVLAGFLRRVVWANWLVAASFHLDDGLFRVHHAGEDNGVHLHRDVVQEITSCEDTSMVTTRRSTLTIAGRDDDHRARATDLRRAGRRRRLGLRRMLFEGEQGTRTPTGETDCGRTPGRPRSKTRSGLSMGPSTGDRNRSPGTEDIVERRSAARTGDPPTGRHRWGR